MSGTLADAQAGVSSSATIEEVAEKKQSESKQSESKQSESKPFEKKSYPNLKNQQRPPVYQQPPPPPPPPPSSMKPPPPPKKKAKTQKAENHIFEILWQPSPSVKKHQEQYKGNLIAPNHFAKMSDEINWPAKWNGEKWVWLPLNEDMREIIEDAQSEEQYIQWQPRQIRFIYGQRSIFVDEQEAVNPQMFQRDTNGRNQLLDNPNNSQLLLFVNRRLKFSVGNSTLYYYLRCSNMCQNQHPKAQRMEGKKAIYKWLDFGFADNERVDIGAKRKKCYDLASTAKLAEMIPHAKYLAIPFFIAETGEEREIDAIRADYVDKAYNDPVAFEQTFGDPKVKLMYAISKLQQIGQLSVNAMVAGQAHWTASKKFITLLPPDRNPVEYLAEFSLSEQGAEFASHMQAFRAITEPDLS